MHKNKKIVFTAILIFFSLIFLLRYLIIGQAVYGDGIYYYAYTRSLVKDRNLHFENEFEHRYGPDTNNDIREIEPSEFSPDTPTNHVSNKYPIGAGLLWIPVFSIADVVANIINQFDSNFPNTGYSDIYQVSVGLFNISMVVLGFNVLYKTLLLFFKKTVSIISILAVTLGSNIFYYSAIDAINSHPLSFLFGTIYFYVLFKDKFKQKFIILGFVTGILALIRTQDIIFIAFTILYLLFSKYSLKEKLLNLLTSSLVFTVVFTVQMLSWKIIYGSFLALPYISGNEGFDFLKPHFLEVLFSLKIGLFIWTPFYLISVIGLIISYKKIPKIVPLFIVAQIYLISSWSGWSQGESFGIRMLISILPLFCIGFAQVIQKLKLTYSAGLTVLLIIFNFTAILYFLIFTQNPTINMGENTQEKAFEQIYKLFR